jgi:hypothetical protein
MRSLSTTARATVRIASLKKARLSHFGANQVRVRVSRADPSRRFAASWGRPRSARRRRQGQAGGSLDLKVPVSSEVGARVDTSLRLRQGLRVAFFLRLARGVTKWSFRVRDAVAGHDS